MNSRSQCFSVKPKWNQLPSGPYDCEIMDGQAVIVDSEGNAIESGEEGGTNLCASAVEDRWQMFEPDHMPVSRECGHEDALAQDWFFIAQDYESAGRMGVLLNRGGLCLDDSTEIAENKGVPTLYLYSCKQTKNQLWYLNIKDKMIMSRDSSRDDQGNEEEDLSQCRCLARSGGEGSELVLKGCDTQDISQKFENLRAFLTPI